MKHLKFIIVILVLVPSVNSFTQTTEIVINEGTAIYVPLGREICADYITVNEGGTYITEDSSGTCDGATIRGEGTIVLPVELISFTANVIEYKVILKWETETELNNFGFEILRLAQKNKWSKIGFVEGHGTSTSRKKYSFTDKNLLGGNKFLYRLKQIDFDGKIEYSNVVEIEIVPTIFALYQNYPNPFNPTTKIRYQLPKESTVVIKIYDILGAEVITLLNEKKEPGVYEVDFNAQHLSSGTYIYRIVADGFVETKKMVLLK